MKSKFNGRNGGIDMKAKEYYVIQNKEDKYSIYSIDEENSLISD